MKLISASPSPYARKVRIALAEKSIGFDLVTEVPWNQDTTVTQFNPLGKVPVLIPKDDEPIYDSRMILDWLDIRFPLPPLIPVEPEDILALKRLETLADGICDAVVLAVIENTRDSDKRSETWTARQDAKIRAGIAQTARMVNADDQFLVADMFSRADIAVGAMLGYVSLRYPHVDWRSEYPELAQISDRLEARPSFKETVPVAQTLADKIA